MDYRKAVAEAATALKQGEDANWKLARLTYEVCGPPGRGREPMNTQYVPLAKWSEDVADPPRYKFSSRTASLYRQIWADFGEKSRHGAISWRDAYDATRGETPDERMSEFNLRRGWEAATPEVKREAFETFARDTAVHPSMPNVVRDVVKADQPIAGEVVKAAFESASTEAFDPAYRSGASRRQFTEAGNRWYHENEQRREEQTKNDPVLKKLDETRAAIDVQAWVDDLNKYMQGQIAVLFRDIMPRLGDLPDADPLALRMLLRSALRDFDATMEPLRTYAATGKYDLDSFLQEVLNTRG